MGAAWAGVWLGVGDWVGDGLDAGVAGSPIAGVVSEGCVFWGAWVVGPSAIGGVVSRQPKMSRTTAKQNNKSVLFLPFITINPFSILT
jgi:hypothetical protein